MTQIEQRLEELGIVLPRPPKAVANYIAGVKVGEILYVADHGGGKTYAYAIGSLGTLSGKREFAPQGSDGVTLDEQGNLYLTGGEGVTVYSPEGRKIETIAVPMTPANVGFGGPENDILYITARTTLFSVKMKVKGQ